jgi:hypothetical protein
MQILNCLLYFSEFIVFICAIHHIYISSTFNGKSMMIKFLKKIMIQMINLKMIMIQMINLKMINYYMVIIQFT